MQEDSLIVFRTDVLSKKGQLREHSLSAITFRTQNFARRDLVHSIYNFKSNSIVSFIFYFLFQCYSHIYANCTSYHMHTNFHVLQLIFYREQEICLSLSLSVCGVYVYCCVCHHRFLSGCTKHGAYSPAYICTNILSSSA